MELRDLRPQKILIVNIFGIGDVLFTTPLINNLKYYFPDCRISYLANRRTAPFLKDSPKLDQVFIYERDDYVALRKQSQLRFFQKLRADIKELKKQQFDLVIDLSLNGSVSFLMWLAGIKERLGFNYKKRSAFLNHSIELKGYEDRHVVEYYLDFLKEFQLDIKFRELELHIKPEDHSWAQEFLKKTIKQPKKWLIGLVPGGGASWGKEAVYKRWSSEKYAKLADKIIEKFPADIILLGDQSEKELCSQVAQTMQHPSYSACGETSVGQFAALMQLCQINIVNDGGPLHIAVAAGAQTVSIFGPVDEVVYGPYPPGKHSVVTKELACRPCYRRFRMAQCNHISCLGLIQVEDVLDKVKEIL